MHETVATKDGVSKMSICIGSIRKPGVAASWCAVLIATFILGTMCGPTGAQEASWQPVKGHIMTRWAKDVSSTNALPEYPRPMMKRENWKNLNGIWEFAMRPKGEASRPEKFDDHILVPFCVESALSGVKKKVVETDMLWYRRTFDMPREWAGRRILLHFGAVDWETTVWVNGKEATHHRGGYDPFSIDITDMLKTSGPQEIVLSVWDPTDKGLQARGKQQIIPEGFMYTPASGIWQTVWLEPVPPSHIRSIRVEPDIDENCVWLTVEAANTNDAYTIEAKTLLPGPGQKAGTIPVVAESRAGQRVRISLANDPKTRLWSPDSPFLYDLEVTLKNRAGKPIDTVDSYFGMRKIEVAKDEDGINRLFLNNKPLFQFGFLDQGWWPDGLYTGPTDEALRYDIETTKRLGANMVRKHVKFEPQRFYYWCDKLGILVWQDMPSAVNHRDQMKRQFELELKRIIDAARNHPSIVMWVAFNEGWGQFDAPRIARWIKNYDPTRLVNHASGWADRGDFGDVRDIHLYPGPGVGPALPNRAMVLGEFGAHGMAVKGNSWGDDSRWSKYGPKETAHLTKAYLRTIRALRPMIYMGLSAAVYTQITDIENELNGLMTYDRELLKMDARQITAVNLELYDPQPVVKTMLATSQQRPQTWRYTTTKPSEDWYRAGYDDSVWKTGPAGFGQYDVPTNIVAPRTKWTSSDIWIRRSFDLSDKDLVSPHFLIHHDEGAEVYINGQLAVKLPHHNAFYTLVPLDKETVRLLKAKANCMAVHCRNTNRPQYIDVGIVDVLPPSRAAGSGSKAKDGSTK